MVSDSGATGGTFLGVYTRMMYRVYRYNWCYYITHAQRREWYYIDTRWNLKMCFSKILAQSNNNNVIYCNIIWCRKCVRYRCSCEPAWYNLHGRQRFRVVDGCGWVSVRLGGWGWGGGDCSAMTDINEKRPAMDVVIICF